MTSMLTLSAHLEDLRTSLNGELALPGQDGYALATPWNVAVPVHPGAVVAAADAADIATTIRFANQHGLRVAVMRTGHGAVALDSEDVLLVHTGRLDELRIDVAARTARVGAGHLWQAVLDAATAHGLAPLVGSAPYVGVVGYLTGGGIGPMVRTFGNSADFVRSFDVVTGDGQLRRAAPDENSELFWGLRGGKGTLGVVTAVEIDLVPLSSFYGGALYFDGADAAAVLHAWRGWVADLPEHASTSAALLQLPPLPQVPPPLAGRLTLAIRYASVAPPDRAEALLAPLRAVAQPVLDGIGELPYAAIGAVHADPVDPMPTHDRSALLRELPAEAVDTLLALAGAGSGSPQTLVELRLLGGALARPEAHASAVSHRSAAVNLLISGVLAPEIAAVVPAHAAALVQAMTPWATGGQLPNFASDAGPARCYSKATLARLSGLADKYDPAGVLRVGQVARSGGKVDVT